MSVYVKHLNNNHLMYSITENYSDENAHQILKYSVCFTVYS